MDKNEVIESSIEIDGTTYIVSSIKPSKSDIKVIKNKVKKLILNNIDNNTNSTD